MTKKASMTAELAWDHAPHDVPQSGLSRRRAAAPDELARIARALELTACASLTADYAITATTSGRYRLTGSLRAEIEQTCVVTLEPIASTIDERFDLTFWPEEDMPAPQSGEVGMDEEPEPEPMLAGQIAVGRVVFECLAMAINPFPRRPDATLDCRSSAPQDAAAEASSSPFAVLANIKTKD